MFAEYVASKENPADSGSRISNLDTEWELNNSASRIIEKEFGKPEIDLFPSRINSKYAKFCSRERDTEGYCVNALSVSWKDFYWFAFPPFALIPRILEQIKEGGCEGIPVVPDWPAQARLPVSLSISLQTTQASSSSSPVTDSRSAYKAALESQGLEGETIEILLTSLAENTYKQH